MVMGSHRYIQQVGVTQNKFTLHEHVKEKTNIIYVLRNTSKFTQSMIKRRAMYSEID